ncbi:MAG: 4-hydroxy-tetrahydrodipicolinate reductase [Christensenellaceae bacterium]|nr:4-hydroxy-tetrahydrodipicolinate reductase [Christensenellaceae bacterium]
MIKVIICGINGKMGQVTSASVKKAEGMELVGGIDIVPDAIKNDVPVFDNIADCNVDADVIIDFSRPAALEGNLRYAANNNCAIIIATTGYSAEQKAMIKEASKSIPVFFSANMSLGVNMQFELVRQISDFYGEAADIEIIERHHNLKVDAPSGTALALADIINDSHYGRLNYKYGRNPDDGRRDKSELGIHSIRGGTFVGEHDVMFITDSEVLTVTHTAQTKQVFADGAIRAVYFISGRKNGLYSMKDIVYQTKTVTSIKCTDDVSLITVSGGEGAGFAGKILGIIADAGIVVDVIIMGNNGSISFSVPGKDSEKALSLLEGENANAINGLSKISVSGLGMELMHGVAVNLFAAIGKSGADIQAVTTSETEMEFLVETKYAPAAVMAVEKEYNR